MSKTLRKGLSLMLALVMLFSIMVTFASAETASESNAAASVSRSQFSGRIGEWSRVDHSLTTANDLTLRSTTDGDVLYAIVEGANRDTRNVFYISIDGVEGFNFIGRPNVSYVIANGYLYKVAKDMAEIRQELAFPFQATNANSTPGTPVMTDFAEWFGADGSADAEAIRLERIGMDYFRTWTGLRLRLDQIGNPDPSDISISWRGFGTGGNDANVRNLPSDIGTLLKVGVYSSTREDNTYYPAEDYSVIFNPLRGGGSNLQSSEQPDCTCNNEDGSCSFADIHVDSQGNPLKLTDGPVDGQFYGYAYINWRSLEPEYGVFDWDGVRMYTKGDYPVVGPNMDQYQCARGFLVTRALEEYAKQGAYVQLRFVMDYPFGSPFGYWTGSNYVGGTFDNDPQGLGRSHAQIAHTNLLERKVADIPDWLIERMRSEPNRPNPDCPDNIPNRPDPENPSELYRCTLRDGTGAVVKVCPNGCTAYERPAGLRTTDLTVPAANGHPEMIWKPNENWGPEGVWYHTVPPTISGGVGLTPRYDHHLMLEYHQRAINALAAEIARPGSVWNTVANVQLGSLGRWGEWHNWPATESGTFPNAQVAYPFVRHYVEAFEDNPNVQIGMRYANWISTKYNFGMFHDQSTHANHLVWVNTIAGQNLSPDNNAADGWGAGHGGAAGMADNLGANMANVQSFTGLTSAQYTNAHRNPTWWMHAWSGGEYGDNSAPSYWFWQQVQFDVSLMGDIHRGGMHNTGSGTASNRIFIMHTLNSFRWANVSNLAPRGPNAGRTYADTGSMQAAHKNNDAAYDNMGYIYVVEEVAVDGDLERGNAVDVSMVVNNRGVAPFYRNWPFEVSWIDSNGNVAAREIIEDIDIREWMPRHRAYNNARPAPANGMYRTTSELSATGTLFIPAFDGRNEVSFTVNIPADLSNQEHTMAIAILDPLLLNGNPGIRFHNMGSRDDKRLAFDGIKVDQAPTVLTTSSSSQLKALLEEDGVDVNLTTPGSGGFGISASNTLTVPAGRTLYVSTILNVRRDATLHIEGTVVVLEGGRINNDGGSAGGGTIVIAEGGTLINNGRVESVTNSTIINNGIITNNGEAAGDSGRFEVREKTTFINNGVVDGTRALNIHRNAILEIPQP